jgi:hypothetical protein
MPTQTTKPDQQISTLFSKSNSLESSPFEVKKPTTGQFKQSDKPHYGITTPLEKRQLWKVAPTYPALVLGPFQTANEGEL